MAIPIAIGVEMIRASADEYSVPQMKGRAPNSPCTGVPGIGRPETPAELGDGEQGLPVQLDADADDGDDQQKRERARPETKDDFVRTGARRAYLGAGWRHWTWILASAAISRSTTCFGSGAYPRSVLNFWPSVMAHFMKSTMILACALSLGFS